MSGILHSRSTHDNFKGKSKRILERKNDIKHLSQTSEIFNGQPKPTKVLSLDCEMVSNINDKDMLARVSIVNYGLQCVYDKFVKPTMPVGDYRTRVSGIRESDLENGVDFQVVQEEVKAILKNKILVGHSIHHDFKVLKIWHPKQLVRDTSRYKPFLIVSDGKTPSLKRLAKEFIGEDIQGGEHSSVEDAKIAMKLYIKYRHDWEASLNKI